MSISTLLIAAKPLASAMPEGCQPRASAGVARAISARIRALAGMTRSRSATGGGESPARKLGRRSVARVTRWVAWNRGASAMCCSVRWHDQSRSRAGALQSASTAGASASQASVAAATKSSGVKSRPAIAAAIPASSVRRATDDRRIIPTVAELTLARGREAAATLPDPAPRAILQGAGGAAMAREVAVIDCDGHLVESVPELAEYMDPMIRANALTPLRNRQGVFPSLDGFHYPTSERREDETESKVRASSHRAGSGEDVLAFLEKAEIEHTVLYPSEGLAVGNIGVPEYAVRLCRAYNDYVADRFRRLSPRIHPAALIPMQDPKEAVIELRRAVK